MLRKAATPGVLGTLLVISLGASAPARAQDCTTNPAPSATCFHFKGSDTLFDVISDGITQARALTTDPVTSAAAKKLIYDGTGSGNAASQMEFSSDPAHLGVQSIGPMSRNFRPNEIDSAATNPAYVQRDATHSSAAGHVAWAPQPVNVLGLDAAVFVFKSNSSCFDLTFGKFTDANATPVSVDRANINDKPTLLPLAFGNGGAWNNAAPAANYRNQMSLLLAGRDGSGSIAACSAPERIQALVDLKNCLGTSSPVQHLYRRDDNSGTTDTIRDRIMVVNSQVTPAPDPRYPFVGGRFCNGRAIGGIDGSVSKSGFCSGSRAQCTTDANCPTGQVCQFNLNNQDYDPVRRDCIAADGTHAPTTCTNVLTGANCAAGDANCTQGFVVALSDTDPGGPTDITTSIAARVKNDPDGTTIGYAGREAITGNKGTRGPSIRGNKPNNNNVRKDAYLLSRRLFLQNGFIATSTPDVDQIDDLGGTRFGLTGQGAAQRDAEQAFFNWITNPGIADSLIANRGFVPCSDDGTPHDLLPNNLCSTQPAAPPATLGNLFPSDVSGGTTSQAIPLPSSGVIACTSGSCISTATACTASFCPAANGRPANAACSQNSDCASNSCTDVLGIGLPNGEGLLCN
ncbi:MAG TPA: hypothetical protein VMT11_17650 [Myxococcaceae bacterium]|nr:hypothetical protein [Myxococcaceae bacterium]